MLPGVGTRSEAQNLLEQVQKAISGSMDLCGAEVFVASSVGVAFFPQDACDPLSLLKHADSAMHYAKRHGRDNLQFFTEDMGAVDRERLELENDLRRAIANGELLVYYQPQVDLMNGRIRGAEALLRWNHPVRGLVPPSVFIPIAEETGLIQPIGDWVLREGCRQLRQWHDRGFTHLNMAVNLSAEQFSQGDLVARVKDAVQDAGIPPACLELELTETAVMRNTARSVQLLGEIVALGVRVSVDDFGTGYSSLSYLQRLPLHTLKIDRSFIHDIENSRDNAEIVRAIVSLAHSLRLQVTAEGVETIAQHDFVRLLGCEQYQGFLCSPPVPAEAFLQALQRNVGLTSSRLRRLLPMATG
jgi:EAL domain-containing protein (putative c-di-GMP-specific phosphodiesterase class I)